MKLQAASTLMGELVLASRAGMAVAEPAKSAMALRRRFLASMVVVGLGLVGRMLELSMLSGWRRRRERRTLRGRMYEDW
jgi:hypothetical protein